MFPPKNRQAFSPLLFPHLGDKKPERRIIAFNSASQIRVLKARKLSNSRQLSTGFLASRFFFRHAEDFLKFTSACQSRKKILCEFLTLVFPCKIMAIRAIPAHVWLFRLRPIPNNAPVRAKKSSALLREKPPHLLRQNSKDFPETK